MQEKMEGVFELPNQDPDPHMTDHSGNTDVHHAVSRDNKTSVKKLRESNVDIDTRKEVKIISIHSQCILLALTLRFTLHIHKLKKNIFAKSVSHILCR